MEFGEYLTVDGGLSIKRGNGPEAKAQGSRKIGQNDDENFPVHSLFIFGTLQLVRPSSEDEASYPRSPIAMANLC
jgi:hypothetical protein